jgi:hypothetical protein
MTYSREPAEKVKHPIAGPTNPIGPLTLSRGYPRWFCAVLMSQQDEGGIGWPISELENESASVCK